MKIINVKDETYDLLEDPLFDKFRIEHDEDFCRWIFEEMDRGAKVYPHDDIPNFGGSIWISMHQITLLILDMLKQKI